jgi:restriction system protein
MAIPDFQSLMLPLLKLTSDGNEKSIKEAVELLAQHFELSEAEQKKLTPGGKQRTFYGRVGWARTYLQKALLLEHTGKARFRITERGQQVLQSHPEYINIKFLKQFPEFVVFTQPKSSEKSDNDAQNQEVDDTVQQTPQEILEENFQILRQSLAQEILETIKSCSPQFFERLVVDVLVAMGYGGSRKDAGQAVGQSGDGGIDGIIKEDKLGLDTIYIQAKRWEGTVGAPSVQGFAGALMGKKARKGVFITTSHFSQQAINFANGIDHLKIILMDGEQLVNFMIDHDVGVTEEDRYTLKKIDQDYFDDAR